MSNFELNKHDWYEVQNSEENDFLNQKLTSTDYGIWYSVKFVGDAETYLWQTKTEPIPGEKYWGWLEETKSGKSVKFKWDKKNAPQDFGGSARPSESQDTQDNIARSVALKAAVDYWNSVLTHTKSDATSQAVLEIADDFLVWLQNTGSESQVAHPPVDRTKEEKSQPARDSEWDEPIFDPDTGERIS